MSCEVASAKDSVLTAQKSMLVAGGMFPKQQGSNIAGRVAGRFAAPGMPAAAKIPPRKRALQVAMIGVSMSFDLRPRRRGSPTLVPATFRFEFRARLNEALRSYQNRQ
jgi:hypothetical protein